jgi:hypothetical protein
MNKEIKPYRLLVVEDNPGDYMLLEQYLTLRRLFFAVVGIPCLAFKRYLLIVEKITSTKLP